MSYENFCLGYDLIGNRNTFKSITKAISTSIICLIKGISQIYLKNTSNMLQTKYFNFPITPKAKE